MSVHVPTQPVSRPSSSQARDGAQLEPAVLAVVAPQADLGVDGPPVAGGRGPALRQVGHLVGMERGVVGQERATGRVPPRVLGPAAVAVEDATCSVGPPGDERDRVGQVAISAIVAIGRVTDIHSRIGRPGRGGRVWHGSSLRGCHRSAGRGAAGSRYWSRNAVTRAGACRRNRPCNDMTSPGWAFDRPGYTPSPDNRHRRRRGNVVCMSRLSISVRLRQGGIGLRFAMLGQMAYVFAEIPASGSAGTLARTAVLAAPLGLRHRRRADVRQRRPARDHPGRPGLPRPGRWSRALVRDARAGPGRRLRADRTRRRRERRTARGPGFRRRRSRMPSRPRRSCRPSRPGRSPPARSGPRPGRCRRTS